MTFATLDAFLARHRRIALATIVTIALVACGVWAARVPLLGAPDENTHTDYALAIWSNGAPVAAATHPLRIDVHPYTKFFERVGAIDRTRFDDAGRLPAGYGSAAYFAAADRTAPRVPRDWWTTAYGTPYIAGSYPFGFYALQALVFGIAFHLSGSPIAAFFAMRAFDVALLGVTLVACYGALRELRVRPALALALTAAIGWLPTMQALYAAVQPDALAVTLFQVTLWLGLRVRRRAFDLWHALAIGAVFALFAVVKVHVFAAAALAIAPAVLWRCARDRTPPARALALAAIALVPAVVTHALASRFERHGPSDFAYSNFVSPLTRLRTESFAYVAASLRVAADTLRDLWGAGPAEFEYYRAFSCLHTPMFDGTALRLVDLAIAELTTIVVIAMAVRTIFVARALVRVARRRSPATALRLLTGEPVLLGYVTFAAVIVAAEVFLGEVVKPEGRYLLPVVLGCVLLASRYAPRALPAARRRGAGVAFAAILCAFGAAGTVAGLVALQHRYYEGGDRASAGREYAIYLNAFAVNGRGRDVRVFPRGDVVHASGYAFDSHRTTPTEVVVRLDGSPLPVRNGLRSRAEVAEIGDERLATGGFAFDVESARLVPGTHELTFFAREPGGLLPATRRPLRFRVLEETAARLTSP